MNLSIFELELNMHRKMKLLDESLARTKPFVADVFCITHLIPMSFEFSIFNRFYADSIVPPDEIRSWIETRHDS